MHVSVILLEFIYLILDTTEARTLLISEFDTIFNNIELFCFNY